MKKNILIIVVYSLLVLSVKGQFKENYKGIDTLPPYKLSKFSMNVGIDQGVPVGYVADHSSYVIGTSVQAEYRALPRLGLTMNASYIYFLANYGGTGLSLFPLKAGVNFYITPKLYLSGQLGSAFYFGEYRDKSMQRGYLSYSQGVGYQLSKRINLLAKFEGINTAVETNYSFVGFRAAYLFPWRKKNIPEPVYVPTVKPGRN